MGNNPVAYLLRETEVLEIKWEWCLGKPVQRFNLLGSLQVAPSRAWHCLPGTKYLKEHGGMCQPRAICKGDSL